MLFTDRGEIVADPVPAGVLAKDKRGWLPVTVPLSRFQGEKGATLLRAVGIFADQSDTFYLGQVRLTVDHTPVRAAVKADPGVARTDELISFSTEITGGASDPEVAWNFGDSGKREPQAVGPKVKYIYKKPGDYIVTATVTDRAGVQPPVTESTGVHVEEVKKAQEEEK